MELREGWEGGGQQAGAAQGLCLLLPPPTRTPSCSLQAAQPVSSSGFTAQSRQLKENRLACQRAPRPSKELDSSTLKV